MSLEVHFFSIIFEIFDLKVYRTLWAFLQVRTAVVAESELRSFTPQAGHGQQLRYLKFLCKMHLEAPPCIPVPKAVAKPKAAAAKPKAKPKAAA